MSEKYRISRTIRSLLVLVLVLVVLAGLEVFSRFLLRGSPLETPQKVVSVTIPQGATISEIGTILRDSSLIEHAMLFKYAVRLMGADTKIQAGNIELVTGQSLLELIRRLTRAKAMGAYVTFREGLTSMEIAGILEKRTGIDSAQFMSLVSDTQFVRELGVEAPSLEGYLFPDTYALTMKSDPRRIAMRMVENFRAHLPVDFEQQAQTMAMSMNEVVTLASIVQWETSLEHEAPLVSSVYHNRLRKHMPLQADPTVSYALGKGPARLYFSDLQVDSPYNTYRHAGLPPGAINNPGRRAIDATLNPASTNYLYFVAQGDGSHAFTSNLADHLTAKQKLDRLRRENGRVESSSPDSIRSNTVPVTG